jgi:hypothetical protein
MSSAKFLPGLELGRLYHREFVAPFLSANYPRLEYASALIGPGSEVLGFDTEISADHDWHPRVLLFLADGDEAQLGAALKEQLSRAQPEIFYGHPTRPSNPADLRFRVVTSVEKFWQEYLGCSAQAKPAPKDWLTFPEHRLLSLTAGEVYRDGNGELAAARRAFGYYPDDIWLYMLAAQWGRISQEAVFVSRCGDAGDDTGSRLLAAKMIREVMRLCFLVERRYAPYSKWFGSAFMQLPAANGIQAKIDAVLDQKEWKGRELRLNELYLAAAAAFNDRKIAPHVEPVISSYHGRPYQVLNAGDFCAAAEGRFADPAVSALTARIGAIDQFTDSTEILYHPDRARKMQGIY